MEESILISVKRMLGIDPSYSDFDADIIMSVNSAIHTLYQVGYRPAKDFIVECVDQRWEDLTGEENPGGVLSLIKTYIYAKVRMLFDPPTSSFVLTSLDNQTKELEWRIYAEMEGGFADDEEDESGDDSDCSCGEDDPGDEPDDDDPCGGNDPWEGVPGNDPDEDDESGDDPGDDPDDGSDGKPDCGCGTEPDISDTLRRLRNEMGRP